MPLIRFDCPACGKHLNAPEDCVGRKTACPKCGKPVFVPSPQRSAPPSVPPLPPPRPPQVKAAPQSVEPQTASLTDLVSDVEFHNEAVPHIDRKGGDKRSVLVGGLCLLLGLVLGGSVGYALGQRRQGGPPESSVQESPVAQTSSPRPPAPRIPPGDMTLKEFILQKPAGPVAVQVDCWLDTYYNFAFSRSAETHYSFNITTDNPRAHAHAYAPKDSEHGRYLYELLKDGRGAKGTVRLERVGPRGDPLPADYADCFALVDVVMK